MDVTVGEYICIFSTTATLLLTLASFGGVFFANVFLWYKTGTFPAREKAIAKIIELEKERESRHQPGATTSTDILNPANTHLFRNEASLKTPNPSEVNIELKEPLA